MPKDLAALLLDEGAVSPDALGRALDRQREHGGALDTALLEEGAIGEEALLGWLSRAAELPPAPASAWNAADARARRVFPSRVAERHGLAPFALDDRDLALVATYPVDTGLLDEISFMLSLHLTAHVAPEWRVRELIHRLYGSALPPRLAALARGAGAFAGAATGAGGAPRAAREEEPPPPAAPAPTGFARDESEPHEPLAAALQQALESFDPSLFEDEPAGEAPEEEAEEGGAPSRDRSAPPRWKLEDARAALAAARDRDDVVLAAVRYARDFFEYAAVFAVTRDAVAGHDAIGLEDERERARSVAIWASDPGIFRTVIETRSPFLGPVSPEAAGNEVILSGLGRERPHTALVYPVLLRDRPVCVLYADNGEAPVSPRRLGDLLLFLSSLGAAFERIIRERKKRRRGTARAKGPLAEAGAPAAAVAEPPPVEAVALAAPLPPPAEPVVRVAEPAAPPGEAAAPGAGAPTDEAAAPPEEAAPAGEVAASHGEAVAPELPVEAAPTERPGAGAARSGESSPGSDTEVTLSGLAIDFEPGEPEPEPAPESTPAAAVAATADSLEALEEQFFLGAVAASVAALEPPAAVAAPAEPALEPPAAVAAPAEPAPEPPAAVTAPAELAPEPPVSGAAPAAPAEASRTARFVPTWDEPPPVAPRVAPPRPPEPASEPPIAPRVAPASGSPAAIAPEAPPAPPAAPAPLTLAALADRALDNDPTVSAAACDALAGRRREPGLRPATEKLRRALLSGISSRATRAARAIEAIRDVDAIPLLIQVLEVSEPETARAAADALAAITLQRLGPDARKWLGWWKENRGRGRAEWLLSGLTSGDRDTRVAAAAELSLAAPPPVAYSADLPAHERERLARAWAVWWARSGQVL